MGAHIDIGLADLLPGHLRTALGYFILPRAGWKFIEPRLVIIWLKLIRLLIPPNFQLASPHKSKAHL